MTGVLLFSCRRCGHTFSTDQWIAWENVADAVCPKCGAETSRDQ